MAAVRRLPGWLTLPRRRAAPPARSLSRRLKPSRAAFRPEGSMTAPFNVLFLCTGNSARSILAESLLNHLGHGRFHGYSAGSFPKGAVHPLSLQLLRSLGLPTDAARSKS